MRADSHRCAQLGQQGFHVERDRFQRELAGLDLGEIEDVVDQAEQCFRAALDGFGVVVLLAVEIGVQQQAGHADHTVHRRADFMAHVGEKIALRTAGLLGRVPGLLQLGLGLFAFADILLDADVGRQVLFLVEHRG